MGAEKKNPLLREEGGSEIRQEKGSVQEAEPFLAKARDKASSSRQSRRDQKSQIVTSQVHNKNSS